jgi:protein arginine phosphatase
MAEALFRLRRGDDSSWEPASAGLYAAAGHPASQQAVEVLRELKIDLSAHRSQPLTEFLAEKADLLVTMTDAHRETILHSWPKLAHKVFLIKSFGTSTVPADVSDPYGGSLQVYRKTRDEIDQALSDLILYLRTGH